MTRLSEFWPETNSYLYTNSDPDMAPLERGFWIQLLCLIGPGSTLLRYCTRFSSLLFIARLQLLEQGFPRL